MRESRIFTLLVVVLAAFGGLLSGNPVFAKAVRVDAVEAELVADRESIAPGETFKLGLRIRHDPHWHTYWRNPGDSGLPTVFVPRASSAGFEFGEIQWPAPQRIAVGPLLNFGYEGELLLPIVVKVPKDLASGAQTTTFSTQAQWLVCKDVCIPGEAELKLSLPVRNPPAGGPAGNAAAAGKPSAWASLFESMAARAPSQSIKLSADVLQSPPRSLLLLRHEPSQGNDKLPGQLEFFPYADGLIRNSAKQTLALGTVAGAPAQMLEVALADDVDRAKLQTAEFFNKPAGVLVRDGQAFEVLAQSATFAAEWKPSATQATTADKSAAVDKPVAVNKAAAPAAAAVSGTALNLGVAMLFAAIGGLILNLMPCVFPVIGLKVLGFVGEHGARQHAWRHALAFAVGVIATFWLLALILLALRSAGQALGWGFQLQSPWFVAAMAMLFVVIGLNLSGLFEFGARLTQLGSLDRAITIGAPDRAAAANASTSPARHFGSGVLAVLVATPCTAPFMGSALGYTLSQPLAPTLAVFTAMGVGMSLPYLLLGLFPAWTRWLPRPGRWMETVKQFFAFPMYATAVWLAWVLTLQAGVDAVLALGGAVVMLAMAAWVYGRFIQSSRPTWLAWSALVVSLLLALWSAAPILTDTSATSSQALDSSSESASNPKAVSGQLNSNSKPNSNSNPAVLHWRPWSPQAVSDALAQGKPVFVDFTAAWCVSCQANKLLVLDRASVIAAMHGKGVVTLKADWTQRNPTISATLAQFGRNGVPLYLLYKPGGAQPRLLPELLTPAIVLEALASL